MWLFLALATTVYAWNTSLSMFYSARDCTGTPTLMSALNAAVPCFGDNPCGQYGTGSFAVACVDLGTYPIPSGMSWLAQFGGSTCVATALRRLWVWPAGVCTDNMEGLSFRSTCANATLVVCKGATCGTACYSDTRKPGVCDVGGSGATAWGCAQ